MYIDLETINAAAKLISSLTVIVGVVIAVYKFFARDKRQTATIAAIQKEQTLLCYGIQACLKGLQEQGCNGPVTAALDKLEKHLNQTAHGDGTT